MQPHVGLADAADLPILVAALREGCPWLVTFNVRHFQPGHPQVNVARPGEFVLHVRDRLAHLTKATLTAVWWVGRGLTERD